MTRDVRETIEAVRHDGRSTPGHDWTMPTAAEIFGRRVTPAPWPSSRPVLALVAEVMPTLEDDFTTDLVEYLALALIDRDDELRAVRAVLSAALALPHAQQVEIIRLKKRLAVLLDLGRQERTAAA